MKNGTDQILPQGEKNDAYAACFTGQSYLALLANNDDVSAFNVTFEPGCRNHWHAHLGSGQILICTAGEGWYQEAGKPARRLRAGDVVDIPAGVKHWHGAAKDTWFSHIALSAKKAGAGSEWFEPVGDDKYHQLPAE